MNLQRAGRSRAPLTEAADNGVNSGEGSMGLQCAGKQESYPDMRQSSGEDRGSLPYIRVPGTKCRRN